MSTVGNTVSKVFASPWQKHLMSAHDHKFYPGETASPQQLVLLADEYRHAAEAALKVSRSGKPLSRAPFRFLAIHAVELYLTALLLESGHRPSKLRSLQHDLRARAMLARDSNLSLRQSTQDHLERLSEAREYLTARYDPAGPGRSEINRLDATLAEVAKKVTALISHSDRQIMER